MSDPIVLIPRISSRDPRYQIRNQPGSGIANMRMQVSLETPGFAIDMDGGEMARKVAELIRTELAAHYRRGETPAGTKLPALKQSTIARRRRRKEQERDDTGARSDRYKVRGGGTFHPTDPQTPFHESGLIAESLQVRFKGTESGDPVFIVAWPSGGKKRGLVNDDGRGARQFAVDHYGFETMADVPASAEERIDKMLEVHVADAINAGVNLLSTLGGIGRSVDDFARSVGEIVTENVDGG